MIKNLKELRVLLYALMIALAQGMQEEENKGGRYMSLARTELERTRLRLGRIIKMLSDAKTLDHDQGTGIAYDLKGENAGARLVELRKKLKEVCTRLNGTILGAGVPPRLEDVGVWRIFIMFLSAERSMLEAIDWIKLEILARNLVSEPAEKKPVDPALEFGGSPSKVGDSANTADGPMQGDSKSTTGNPVGDAGAGAAGSEGGNDPRN